MNALSIKTLSAYAFVLKIFTCSICKTMLKTCFMQSSFIHMSTIVNFYFYHYFVPVKNPHVLLVNLICFKCTFSTDYHNLILRACFFFKKTRSRKKFLNPLNLFKQIIPRNHKHQKADLIFFIHFAFHGIHRKFLFRNFIKIMNTLFRVI